MNNWVPNKKIIRSAALITMVCTILYFTGLFVVISKINKIENSYNDIESSIYKQERVWTLKALAENNKEDIKTLRDFFIQKEDEVYFIEAIESTARKSGVLFEIASINEKPKEGDTFEQDILVKIDVEGSWPNILSLLDLLEKMPFGVSIENINLDVDSASKWSGFIELILFKEK